MNLTHITRLGPGIDLCDLLSTILIF